MPARDLARERLVDVMKGADPFADRKAARNAYSVKDLCAWYLLEAESGRLLSRKRRPIKASTLKSGRTAIQKHILPLISDQPLEALTRPDVQRFYADIVAGKTTAKRIGRGGNTTAGTGAGGAKEPKTLASGDPVIGGRASWLM